MTSLPAQVDANTPAGTAAPPQAESPRARRLRKLLAVALLLATAGVLAGLVYRSRDWPMIQDPPAMHYVGWRIVEGDVLYRDLYDGNFPGIYLLHAGLVKVFGITDGGFRCFDLLWLGLTALAMLAYGRRITWPGALAAALLFAVFHLDGGPLRAGQRDYLMVLLLIVSAHATARYAESARGGIAWLALAGVLTGLGATIKPFVVLWGLVLAGFAMAAARKQRRRVLGALGALVGGGTVVLIATVGYLWMAGGLAAFVDILTGYMPLYAKMRRASKLVLLDGLVRYRYVLVLLVLAAAGYIRGLLSGRLSARRGLLIGGLVYGAAHYLLQGKGWGYHLYPFVAFACLMVGLGGEEPSPTAGTGARSRSHSLPWIAMVALLAACATGVYGALTYSDTFVRAQQRTRQKLLAELRARVQPGETVQMMDLTYGGLHVLMEAGVHQSSALLYDFVLYESPEAPYTQALRERFMRELRAAPPKLIAVFRLEGGWTAQGFDRIERFPELARWMKAHYRQIDQQDRYRLYERITGADAQLAPADGQGNCVGARAWPENMVNGRGAPSVAHRWAPTGPDITARGETRVVLHTFPSARLGGPVSGRHVRPGPTGRQDRSRTREGPETSNTQQRALGRQESLEDATRSFALSGLRPGSAFPGGSRLRLRSADPPGLDILLRVDVPGALPRAGMSGPCRAPRHGEFVPALRAPSARSPWTQGGRR